jgi:tetratricopeptide (TPR) repeat protein
MTRAAMSRFLDKINTEFEQSFALCALISREMGCVEESLLAAKRVFSYNPNSTRMLELFPEFAPFIEQISRLVESHGQKLQIDSGNHELWTILGYCYLTLGDFPNAFAAYAHALRVQPESTDPVFWYAMGIVYAHYNYNDHALNCHQKFLSLGSTVACGQDIQFRLGLLHRQLKNFESALQHLDRVKGSPPNGLQPEDVQLQIGYTYQLLGNYDAAMQIYDDLYRRFPNALQLTIQYAWFLFLRSKAKEDYANVSRILNHGLRGHPCDPTLLLITARIAMKQDDMAGAYKQYRYCISYCNDNPSFWCGLGVLYYKNEQSQDAIVAFQRALYLKSEMAEAWLNIGLIFEQQGDLNSANKIYQTGQSKCQGVHEFAERLNALSARPRPGYKSPGYTVIDVDDLKIIRPPPEVFAVDYVAAVPQLPAECFGIELGSDGFKALATFPKSYFV